jgi:electron transfer flavoprotein alpha subunit
MCSLTLALPVYTDCRRPIYAGNAIATVQSGEKLKLLTVRTTAFEKVRAASSSSWLGDAQSKGKLTFVIGGACRLRRVHPRRK